MAGRAAKDNVDGVLLSPSRERPMKARITSLAVLLLAGHALAAEPAKAGKAKAATTAEELLAGMPKASWPAGGKDGVPERAAAEKWMEKNLVGKIVQWPATIEDVKIEAGDGDKMNVTVIVSGNEYGG